MIIDVASHLLEELRAKAQLDEIERLVAGSVVVKRTSRGVVKVLVLDRVPNEYLGGIEELPSGQVEAGEPLMDALVRELTEETGLKARAVRAYLFAFDYQSRANRKTRQLNFLVVPDDAEVRTSAEHNGHRWLSVDELAASRLTRNIVDAITVRWPEIAALAGKPDSGGARRVGPRFGLV
jgi:8-oxo-dGTP diphosphatase